MRFGEFPVREAEGLVLAHSVVLPDGKLPKGHFVTTTDIGRLDSAGIPRIVGVRMEEGDVDEDEAATRLSQAIPADHLRFSAATTGRVNVYAAADGLFVADKMCVDRINRIDPAITLACLADHSRVQAGDMVATFKIIPLAVREIKVNEACGVLNAGIAFAVKPFAEYAVSLIATELPSLKGTVMDKTARVLGRRLAISGNRLRRERRVPHQADCLAKAIADVIAFDEGGPKLVIVFGACAVSDDGDVLPEAIRRAGGDVLCVGMPVDPGNLIVLGRVDETYVIGAPGCARSPKENGFDWVLDRIVAGEQPTFYDISAMGVGGLLMEIESRPRLRDVGREPDGAAAVVIVLLAAGKSSRMGEGGHKLLAEFEGVPLVRRTALTAIAADAASVMVVTGHRRAEIEDALSGLELACVENADYAAGMSSSLIAGFSSESACKADGVLVMLADMPGVATCDLNALISAFRAAGGGAIVRAVSGGKRGNPVILPRQLRDKVMRLEGDVGARHIIETSGMPVIDVDIGDAAHLDVDTSMDVVAAGGVPKNKNFQ